MEPQIQGGDKRDTQKMLCYEASKSQGVCEELLLWPTEISGKISACTAEAL